MEQHFPNSVLGWARVKKKWILIGMTNNQHLIGFKFLNQFIRNENFNMIQTKFMNPKIATFTFLDIFYQSHLKCDLFVTVAQQSSISNSP